MIRTIPVVLLLATASAPAALERALDQTINEVAQEAARKLKETNYSDITTIAVLPLWGDCSPETKAYIVNTIQSQIIGGRYRVIERDKGAWDILLAEIAWGTRRDDIMAPETIQQFSRIAGCDAIVFGTVRECASYPESHKAITRLTLRMSVVQTGEARWSSGEIRSAKIVGPPPQPPVPPNPALVRAINRLAAHAVAGLKDRYVNAANFGFFPLLGQGPDGYVTQVLQAELTKAGCNPAPIARADWNDYLAADSRGADSVVTMSDFARRRGYETFLYGTVNECGVLERKYKARACATLNLVNARTGEVVWSPGEVRGEAWLDWQDGLRLAAGDPLVWVLGGLVALLVLWRALVRLFRSATRPR